MLLVLAAEEQDIFNTMVVKHYIQDQSQSHISGYDNADVFSYAFVSR